MKCVSSEDKITSDDWIASCGGEGGHGRSEESRLSHFPVPHWMVGGIMRAH